MLVYTIWDTPARAAASMALRALSNRSPTVVVETSSIASAPANASSRVFGSAKSARRTVKQKPNKNKTKTKQNKNKNKNKTKTKQKQNKNKTKTKQKQNKNKTKTKQKQ